MGGQGDSGAPKTPRMLPGVVSFDNEGMWMACPCATPRWLVCGIQLGFTNSPLRTCGKQVPGVVRPLMGHDVIYTARAGGAYCQHMRASSRISFSTDSLMA